MDRRHAPAPVWEAGPRNDGENWSVSFRHLGWQAAWEMPSDDLDQYSDHSFPPVVGVQTQTEHCGSPLQPVEAVENFVGQVRQPAALLPATLPTVSPKSHLCPASCHLSALGLDCGKTMRRLTRCHHAVDSLVFHFDRCQSPYSTSWHQQHKVEDLDVDSLVMEILGELHLQHTVCLHTPPFYHHQSPLKRNCFEKHLSVCFLLLKDQWHSQDSSFGDSMALEKLDGHHVHCAGSHPLE